ncbi:hypothetical protein M5D96_011212, partial [Drosophila gunungcola]
IARSPLGRYAIADTGNNRVLVVSSRGLVQHKIGGHQPGFVDGISTAARFNNPQGLAFIDENALIVADTKNHALRKISLTSGMNLFAFGDVDGKLFNAKLQHPLGLTYNDANNRLYVADTYNHKIKVIDTLSNNVSTLQIKGQDGSLLNFNEPAGLCLDADGQNLLVADTNNHSILLIDLVTLRSQSFSLDFSQISSTSETDAPQCLLNNLGNQLVRTLPLHFLKTSSIYFRLRLSPELNFTKEAPQKWILKTVCQSVKVNPSSGTLINGMCNLDVQNVQSDYLSEHSEIFTIEFVLNLCNSNCCLLKRIYVSIISGKTIEDYIPIHDVDIQID